MNHGDPVPTGCSALTELLGGGFERGTVTQVYGPPAAGKTNLSLGAAVETAAGGETAVYIDTEGISVDRFEQLAEARVSGPGTGEADAGGAEDLDVDDVASRIIVTSALDFDEQAEAVRDAADLASQAGLVVLDSATGFYRLERTDESEEGTTLRQVTRQVTHLLSLARKHDLAVIITNQVFSDPDEDRVRPLGGNTLEHWSGTVLRLERFRGGNRRATVEKHRSQPAGESARFRITDTGIDSVEEP